jgi:hypothetical protein
MHFSHEDAKGNMTLKIKRTLRLPPGQRLTLKPHKYRKGLLDIRPQEWVSSQYF